MFTCAVTWHGALYTWGCGARGQLGTGSLQEGDIQSLCLRHFLAGLVYANTNQLLPPIKTLRRFISEDWLGSSNPQANTGTSIDAQFEGWLNHLTRKVLL